MINVQGTFDEGRGASGLGTVRYVPVLSRLGPGVKTSHRPPRLTGKPKRPSSTDMRSYPAGVTTGWMRDYQPPRRAPRKVVRIRHRQQFINWLKRWAPQVYVGAKKRADVDQAHEGTLNGLGGWWESFSDGVVDLGGKVLQYKTQKEILDAQLERMRRGLPPLQTSEYAPTIAIKPDAGTTREITGAIGAGFGQILPWAAAGVGLFLLLGRKKR